MLSEEGRCSSWRGFCGSGVLLLQETHRLYLLKLEEISKLQKSCSSSISSQRSKLKEVSQLVRTWVHTHTNKQTNKPTNRQTGRQTGMLSLVRCSRGPSEDDAEALEEMREKMKTRPKAFKEMEAFLPNKNGWCFFKTRHHENRSNIHHIWRTPDNPIVPGFRLYLGLVLGNVNVTLLSKQSK